MSLGFPCNQQIGRHIASQYYVSLRKIYEEFFSNSKYGHEKRYSNRGHSSLDKGPSNRSAGVLFKNDFGPVLR